MEGREGEKKGGKMIGKKKERGRKRKEGRKIKEKRINRGKRWKERSRKE